jgi:dCTP diphosphatase
MSQLDIGKMQEKLRQVAKDRDWEKFHTPKNLAISLSVEASELLEIFRWLSDEESMALKNNPEKLNVVADEISDVLYHIVRLADVLQIDLDKAFWAKLKITEKKYPVKL